MRLITTVVSLILLANYSIAQVNSSEVELLDKRNMFSSTYLNNDGSKSIELSNGPLNYFEAGEWHPIDTELRLDETKNAFVNEYNMLHSQFPLFNSEPIVLNVDGSEIILSTVKEMITYSEAGGIEIVTNAMNKSAAIVVGNKLVYEDIYEAVSDEYEVLNGEIKNNLILKSQPNGLEQVSQEWYGYKESITLPNGWRIVPILNETELFTSSSLVILNELNFVVASIPAPVFFEKAGEDSDGSGMVEGKFHIEENNGVWNLSTLIPISWLTDSNRNYPIIIDPSVTLMGNTGGWQSQNNYVNNPGYVFMGVCCGNLEHRAWLKWDVSSIPDNSCVTSVELEVFVNGVGGAAAELIHAYDMMETTITGLFGLYGGILPAVYMDQGNGYYTSFTLLGTGTYGWYDLGANAVTDVMTMMNSYDWYQVSLIFDNEPSTNWKRLTATSCRLHINYDAPPCAPLPIELASFDADCNDNNTVLSWTTVTEIENDYFDLEKTYDEQNYLKIATIDGAGNSTVQNSYSYTDYEVDARTAYYRLKQVDFNGDISYHNVLASNCFNSIIEMSMDNQDNVINIFSTEELKGSYQILNTIGQVVQEGEVSAQIPFAKTAGIYFVHILTSDEIFKVEILKN